MSKTVDQKVVSMQFDNRQFESNVQTSMNTLDRLKGKLNLTGAAKGFEQVSESAKKVDMSGLSSAAEESSNKFSALQVVAMGALASIGMAAATAGLQLVKSLSIDQIASGWNKYAEKTASVQTIMNATGKSIDEVNGYLDKLMWFSDETSYSFTDMTQALGQLTSAGGNIDKLVPLITGVANATAFAGKGAQEFSRSMYNLNQSYSAGNLQYMDWKSLELAGVASKQLKETFIETGIALGKISEGEVTIENFGETLKTKWADTSVMEAAFGKFGEMTEKAYKMVQEGEASSATEAYAILAEKYDGVSITAAKAAQEAKTFRDAIEATKDAVSSGWMTTFEHIFGNYEESKKLWTDLSNTLWEVFASGSEARNQTLKEWKELGGRTAAIDAVKNAFKALSAIVAPIKEAFREIFPKKTAKEIFEITERIRDFTKNLIISEKTQASIKSTLKGVFAVVDIGLTLIKQVTKGALELVSSILGVSGGLFETTGYLGDFIVKLRDSIKQSGFFGTIIGGIVKILKSLIGTVKAVVGYLNDKIAAPGFEWVYKLLSGIGSVLSWLGKKIAEFISNIANAFRDGTIKSVFETINTGIMTGILLSIKKFLSGGSMFSDLKDIMDGLKAIFDSVRGSLEAWQQNLKAGTLAKLAGSIALLAVSLLIIASIEPDKLATSLGAITLLFVDLIAGMAVLNKFMGAMKGTIKASFLMISMSIALLIMASALKKISGIDTKSMIVSIAGIAALSMILVAMAKSLSKNTSTIVKGTLNLVMLALAIKVLASACKSLSSLSWTELAKGLVGVGVLLAAVSVFVNKTSSSGKMLSVGVGLVLVASSLKILASVCKTFASMSLAEIAKGLGSVAVSLLMIVGFVKLMGDAKKLFSIGTAMILIATSMKILASAVVKLASLTWSQIGAGLLAMAGALAMITIAMNLMPKNLIAMGFGLLAVSTSLVIMAGALKIMGSMSWEEVGKSLLVLAVSLTALSIALYAMSGTLAGSAALLIAALAIAVLVPSLMLLGAMSWESIIKGLIALAGALAILGVAAAVMTPITGSLLAVAAAFALFGVACLAMGLGLTFISAGLMSLIAVIGTVIGGIGKFVTGILDFLHAFISGLGRIIVAICEVIIEAMPAILKVIGAILEGIIGLLLTYVPKITEAAIELTVGFLNGLAKNIGRIMEAAVNLVSKFLEAIANQLPVVIQACTDFIINVVNGLAAAIEENTPKLMEAFENLGTSIIKGLIKGVFGSMKNVRKTFVEVAKTAWSSFKDWLGIHSPSRKFATCGEQVVQGFANGVKDKASSGVKAVTGMASDALDGAKEKVGEWKSVGQDMMGGLVKGVKSKFGEIKSAAIGGVSGAVDEVRDFLGMHSPSRLFMSFGEYMDEGMAIGLKSYSSKVDKAAVNVGKSASESMSSTIASISDSFNSDIDGQPTIKPVVDLTNIKSGAGAISDMLGMKPSVDVMTNVGAINAGMSRNQNGVNNDVASAINKLAGKMKTGNVYNINGVTYDDGSNITKAIETIVRAAIVERRI